MHSGTSMLLSILSMHPRIYGIKPEIHFFDGYPAFGYRHESEEKDFRRIVERLKVSKEELLFLLDSKHTLLAKTDTIGNLTSAIFDRLSEFHRREFWVEKTPSNVYFVDNILSHFPDSRIILIHRDIRNIIASKKILILVSSSSG